MLLNVRKRCLLNAKLSAMETDRDGLTVYDVRKNALWA
jgi:hypothetical protein